MVESFILSKLFLEYIHSKHELSPYTNTLITKLDNVLYPIHTNEIRARTPYRPAATATEKAVDEERPLALEGDLVGAAVVPPPDGRTTVGELLVSVRGVKVGTAVLLFTSGVGAAEVVGAADTVGAPVGGAEGTCEGAVEIEGLYDGWDEGDVLGLVDNVGGLEGTADGDPVGGEEIVG